MTATATRAEINRRNAADPVLPGEDPEAFRGRLDAWAEALAPADAVEQFLVEQAATASWKIERADRIEAARIAAALRAAEDEQRAGRRKEADRLGRLLLGLDGRAADTDLAREVLRILDPGQPEPAAGRLAPPRLIVDRLESTAEGCAWLLQRWAELGAPLERGTDWDEDRLVEAVRLSGRRPLNLTPESWERHKEGRYLVGAEAVEPGGDEGRQMAIGAAFGERVQAEDRRRMAGQLVEVLPEDQAEARSALLGLVERAIGRLTELASAHEARWEAGALERAERMTFDPGPDDERLWRYRFGCGRSMQRTLDTLLKLRREGRAAGRAAGREEGEGAAPTAAPDEANAQAVAQTSVPDEAATALVATSPPPDEATALFVARTPLLDESNSPLVDRSPPQDEANAPAGGAARKEPTMLVTALALLVLLSSAGLAAAFGRSTVVTPRPSPISAPEPSGPRATHPGGDHKGLGKIPPESVTRAGQEHHPCRGPAFTRSGGTMRGPWGTDGGTIRSGSTPSPSPDRSDSPRGIANPARIPLRWQFSS